MSENKNNTHLLAIQKNNQHEGEILRRHLENMCQAYGARYTTEVILKVLEQEILAIKQSRKAQKVG